MKRFSITMAALLTSLFTPVHALTPVEAYGQLSIDGAHIVDKAGRPVQLVGPSLFWSQWGGKYWNDACISWVVKDWRATVVRAAMAVENNGYLTNRSEANKVKAVVSSAVKNGIYVLIDWHDHNAQNHTAQAKAFFREMAQLYGHLPNVIYEIYNEPVGVGWREIYDYAVEVVGAIREIDPDNIIVVGTPNNSHLIDNAYRNPVPGTNLMYAYHFYAATAVLSQINYVRDLYRKGLPVFVTEWGTSEGNGNGNFAPEKTGLWWDMMDEEKISWCNWSLHDKAETSAALLPGASTTGNWGTANLSPSGRLVRAKLQSYPAPSEATTAVGNPLRPMATHHGTRRNTIVRWKPIPQSVTTVSIAGREGRPGAGCAAGLFLLPTQSPLSK